MQRTFSMRARRGAHDLPPRGYDDDGRRQAPDDITAQSDSNEHEMEPVILEFAKLGAYKTFQPSLAETFGYVLEGSIQVKVGKQVEVALGPSFWGESQTPN